MNYYNKFFSLYLVLILNQIRQNLVSNLSFLKAFLYDFCLFFEIKKKKILKTNFC